MRAVWKFQFPLVDRLCLLLPRGAQVVDAGMQDGHACLWALVDPYAPAVERSFRVYGTGRDISGEPTHLATFRDGRFVWHLFEEGPS